MKKTFKGYSALIALLIALLVVTSMPMFAFAAEGQNKTVEGNQEGHKLTQRVYVVSEPTETKEGIEAWKCDDPAHVKDNIVHLITVDRKDHEHKWTTTYASATCTTPGSVTEKCTCGETRTRTVAALGHYFEDSTFATEPLKDEAGKVVAEDYYINLPTLNFVVKTEEDAKKLETEKENLAKNYGITIVDPNCTYDGVASFKCIRCDETKDYAIKAEPSAHEWIKEPRVIRAATCAEAGLKTRWCTVCSAYEEPTVIEKLKAKWEIKSYDKVDDCYNLTVTVHCVNCNGKTHKDVTKVKSNQLATYGIDKELGTMHDFSKKDIDHIDFSKSKNLDEAKSKKAKKPVIVNCELETVIAWKCDLYDKVPQHKTDADDTGIEKEKIPAGKHTWGEWEEVTAPSATDNGYFIRHCTACSAWQGADGGLIDVPDGEISPVDAKYEIDMTNVSIDGTASGTAEVKVVEGKADPTKLYARITFSYTLSDGQTHAVAVRGYVDSEDNAYVIKVGGSNTPSGATLTGVNVALVSDADAYLKADYAPSFIAGASK